MTRFVISTWRYSVSKIQVLVFSEKLVKDEQFYPLRFTSRCTPCCRLATKSLLLGLIAYWKANDVFIFYAGSSKHHKSADDIFVLE